LLLGNTQGQAATYSRDDTHVAQRRSFEDTISSIVSFTVTMIKNLFMIGNPTRRSPAQRRSLEDIFERIVSFMTTMIKRIFLITDPIERSFEQFPVHKHKPMPLPRDDGEDYHQYDYKDEDKDFML
jgi:hypothetical protein